MPTTRRWFSVTKSDRDFERVVRSFAAGQSLSVLNCDRLEGMVLAPTDDSPFRIRLAEYVQVTSSDMRLLHGLVQLAIAATAYPTAASLEDGSRLVSVSATQGWLAESVTVVRAEPTRMCGLLPCRGASVEWIQLSGSSIFWSCGLGNKGSSLSTGKPLAG